MKDKYLSPWYREENEILGDTLRRKPLSNSDYRIVILKFEGGDMQYMAVASGILGAAGFEPILAPTEQECQIETDEKLQQLGYEFLNWDRFNKLELLA